MAWGSLSEWMIWRICPTDSSMDVMALSRLARAEGEAVPEASRSSRSADSSSPEAKSCWIAKSWRSREICDRSSSCAAWAFACLAEASSRARVACLATLSAMARSDRSNSCLSMSRSRTMTPVVAPLATSGA